jgi:transmembrane sensor
MKEILPDQYSDYVGFKNMSQGEKILSHASVLRVVGGKTKEDALEELKKRISENKPVVPLEVKGTRAGMIWWVSSVAAGILLLFGLWQWPSAFSETRIASARGAHSQYVLPDGSEVNLNSESSLSFNRKRFNKERLLSFEGEGFFNVEKGGSFIITTSKGNVKVLGTSFNVFARNDLFKVTCSTGKVMVTSDGQSVTIDPGESAVYIDGKLKSFRDERSRYVTGWIKGEFYFENAPLNLVFKEISRQFNVKFIGKERENEYFTGSFTNKDLKAALEIVCIPMNLEYEIDKEGEISISDRK